VKSFANLRLWFVEWAGESYPAGQCVHDLATSSFPSLEAVLEVAYKKHLFPRLTAKTPKQTHGLYSMRWYAELRDGDNRVVSWYSASDKLHAALHALWLAAKYEEREER